MRSYPQEQIWQQYKKLPQELKEVIWATETNDLLYEISKKYNILDKANSLARVTGGILMGFIPLTKYRATIQEELGISEDQARQIAYEIRDTLLMRVAEHLRDLHNIQEATP